MAIDAETINSQKQVRRRNNMKTIEVKLVKLLVGFICAIACGSLCLHFFTDPWHETYTDPYCNEADALCGVVIYANAGAYVVNSVHLTAESGTETNAACSGLDAHLKADVDEGQYAELIVPATCSYKLKINIEAGSDKSRNIVLTPGCEAFTETNGTTESNEWHNDKVSWINGDPGIPIDANGNQCTIS